VIFFFSLTENRCPVFFSLICSGLFGERTYAKKFSFPVAPFGDLEKQKKSFILIIHDEITDASQMKLTQTYRH